MNVHTDRPGIKPHRPPQYVTHLSARWHSAAHLPHRNAHWKPTARLVTLSLRSSFTGTHTHHEKATKATFCNLGKRDEVERVKQWECQGIRSFSTAEFSNKNHAAMVSPHITLFSEQLTHTPRDPYVIILFDWCLGNKRKSHVNQVFKKRNKKRNKEMHLLDIHYRSKQHPTW